MSRTITPTKCAHEWVTPFNDTTRCSKCGVQWSSGMPDAFAKGFIARQLKRKRTITPAQYRAMESEASVEQRVTAWLEERGYRVHPLVTEVERGYRGKSRRNPANTPDLIAVLIGLRRDRPRVMYLELKRAKGGKHSAGQLAMADKLRDEGFAVFQHASNGVDVIEQLEAWLRQ